ncbi:hypothetical protein BKA82DRAFT_1003176 [Pisolithus tinctorius]|uniref:Uncharacterized protein n=1 Tax=Pisolithus tinctorius Marx 270 TaxID=870435 RepID=A0A0C3NKK9_PISTI|nr:hypothetical protein BKA82DRAFT_1003176 [Pisolithus tinctorius]KIO01485.1 hypothetical protein M404DRAFT_1003176 [Pisolithus tinctorius Marx 270]
MTFPLLPSPTFPESGPSVKHNVKDKTEKLGRKQQCIESDRIQLTSMMWDFFVSCLGLKTNVHLDFDEYRRK